MSRHPGLPCFCLCRQQMSISNGPVAALSIVHAPVRSLGYACNGKGVAAHMNIPLFVEGSSQVLLRIQGS
jgi:hypothetical protein